MGNLDVNSGVVLINWHFRGLSMGDEGPLTFFQGHQKKRHCKKLKSDGKEKRFRCKARKS
jgi:hypothetical protein